MHLKKTLTLGLFVLVSGSCFAQSSDYIEECQNYAEDASVAIQGHATLTPAPMPASSVFNVRPETARTSDGKYCWRFSVSGTISLTYTDAKQKSKTEARAKQLAAKLTKRIKSDSDSKIFVTEHLNYDTKAMAEAVQQGLAREALTLSESK